MDLREFYGIASGYYDADYAAMGYGQDIPFYLEMAAASGGPVLEMGCGTGRILIPTARAGVPIHGMDLSPEMLAALRQSLSQEPAQVQQRVRLTEGDIRTTRVDGAFPLVTCPFRIVQHLLERDDQRAWLRNVARHLSPGGVLCFDVFQPDYRYLVEAGQPRLEVDCTEPDTGRRIRRLAQAVPRFATQRLEVHYQWLVEDAAGVQVSEAKGSFVLRWYTRSELENLLELEGFQVTDYWGSFRREPFAEGSPQQIIRATRR